MKVFPVVASLMLTLTLPLTSSAFCFERAGDRYGISPELIRAIAFVESGLKPDAKNRNKNGSTDHGLMQVNSRWSASFGDDWDYIEEPCYNVMAGAWILSRCMERFGQGWEAIACYNTGKSDTRMAGNYIRKVKDALQNSK